jgi:hypothetical protein
MSVRPSTAFPLELLRRHVVGRAHHLRRPHVRVDDLREPEVRDLHVPPGVDHDVLGLDVPMDDVLLVRRGEGVGGLLDDRHRLLDGERAPHLDQVREGLALEELHDEVVDRAVLVPPHLVDRHDVGMVEIRGGDRLAIELADELLVRGQGLQEDLDRHRALQIAVERTVDGAEAALPDLLDDLALADDGPDEGILAQPVQRVEGVRDRTRRPAAEAREVGRALGHGHVVRRPALRADQRDLEHVAPWNPGEHPGNRYW